MNIMTDTERSAVLDSIAHVLTEMVHGFIQFPKSFRLTARESFVSNKLTFLLEAHASDIPRIIGSGQVMFASLRYLTQLMVHRAFGQQIVFELLNEPTEGQKQPQPPFFPNPTFDTGPTEDLLRRVLALICGDGVVEVERNQQSEIETMFILRGEVTHDIARSLSTVVHAVGKNHGVRLYVDIEPVGKEAA
jgi:predicted RNA-binding protein YlqC (UPF0109 family)